MADMFTCDNCGATHEKARTDQEAMTEAEKVFGTIDPEDLAVICDDCYQAIRHRWAHLEHTDG